jgi:site-specific recombinase XerD
MKNCIYSIEELTTTAVDFLHKQSYSRGTINKYRSTWEELKKYMKLLNLNDYNVAVGEGFATSRLGDCEYNELTKDKKQILRRINYLTEFQETGTVLKKRKNPDVAFSGSIGQTMTEYIAHSKSLGYSESTIKSHKLYLYRFLLYLAEAGIFSLDTINSVHLITFVKSYGNEKPATKHSMLSVIRGFLKYIYDQQIIAVDYSKKVPKDNFIRQSRLPSIYSKEEIAAMIKAIDRSNPKGKRDYALVLLAARLGLRASDICGLKFENLHWEQCLIVLNQQKTNRKIELPLTKEIGGAIIDYLKYGRPKSEQTYVFLNLIPPYDNMTIINLSSIVSGSLKLAGIDYSSRKHGTHVLRHSLAGILLKDKIPVPVISEVLGHKDTGSTMYYLRIDIDSLRQCALNVPPVSLSFYKIVSDLYFK